MGGNIATISWGADVGLSRDSVVVAPTCSPIERTSIEGEGETSRWEYRGRCLDGWGLLETVEHGDGIAGPFSHPVLRRRTNQGYRALEGTRTLHVDERL